MPSRHICLGRSYRFPRAGHPDQREYRAERDSHPGKMNPLNYEEIISRELNVAVPFTRNTIALLLGGATIPFIARYRKEMTGSLDEVMIAQIRDRLQQLRDLDARRATILKSLAEQGKLTEELEKAITEAATLAELEDLYLPYRPKRKTRASMARERGLEPLAKLILSQKNEDIEERAKAFINAEKEINTVEDAIRGACDIIAEWVNEHSYVRKRIRGLFQKEGILFSKVIKGKEEEGANYRVYFDFHELISKAPSHRVLAIFRGEKEGFLRVSVEVEED